MCFIWCVFIGALRSCGIFSVCHTQRYLLSFLTQMIQFSAFCLCMAKIRARLWARQLKMCLGKTEWLGDFRRFQQGVRALFGNASPPLAPDLGPQIRRACGGAAGSSTEAEPCRYCDIIHTALSCFWRKAWQEILCHSVCTFMLWSLKGLLAQQIQSYLGHSWEKYQSQIHGTFFLCLSCPSLIFLCPALVFFECKYFTQWWS